MVLTFRCARAGLVSWSAVRIAAVAALSVVTWSAASADDWLIVGGCVHGYGQVNCVVRKGPPGDPYVRTVPTPRGEADQARVTERDHKWLQRCRPVIQQDRYGVPRYHYVAAGCEFGVIE